MLINYAEERNRGSDQHSGLPEVWTASRRYFCNFSCDPCLFGEGEVTVRGGSKFSFDVIFEAILKIILDAAYALRDISKGYSIFFYF